MISYYGYYNYPEMNENCNKIYQADDLKNGTIMLPSKVEFSYSSREV